MNLRTEILIVGAGLAGACAAFFLGRDRDVTITDAGPAAGGASSAAAGLVNPLLGRRARPVWQMHEALDALREALDLVGKPDLFLKNGVLRPAVNGEQASRFYRAAERHSELASWMTPGEVADRYPHIVAPEGALKVHEAGAVDISRLCHSLLAGTDFRAGWRLMRWEERDGHVLAHFATADGAVRMEAGHLLIAPGAGYRHLDVVQHLDLHCVKGQTVTVEVPANLPPDHPHVAGPGYIVVEPRADDHTASGDMAATRLVLGSTYHHEFEDSEPTTSATEEILEKTRSIMPPLEDAVIIEERAGVRVTVPRTRLPMVGAIPEFRRTWILSGLGAKGLLTAPLIGRRLPQWLTAPDQIPYDLRPRVRE